MITELQPNQIFVFGANSEGAHGGGAAKFAHDQQWTRWGHSEGLLWQSFAIDTMSGVERIKLGLQDLAITARHNPGLEFLLTPIGQGIAGYTKEQIEELMPDMPDNVRRVGW